MIPKHHVAGKRAWMTRAWMTQAWMTQAWMTRACWILVIAAVLAFAAATSWYSQPPRARVIQVLFPFGLTILGSWFLTLLGLVILRLLFRRDFTITSCAAFALAAAPIAASGGLEEIPGLSRFGAAVSPSFIHTVPLIALLALLALRPRFRTVDRIVFGVVGGVTVGLIIGFHLALTIPEADLSRERQRQILELLAGQPPELVARNAPALGGEPVPYRVIRGEDVDPGDLPPSWGAGAPGALEGLANLDADRPGTAFVMIEPGNTVFERVGWLYDGRPTAGTEEPRYWVFPSTATNASLMNAQRAQFTLSAIGSAFWFLVALGVHAVHARLRGRSVLPGRLGS